MFALGFYAQAIEHCAVEAALRGEGDRDSGTQHPDATDLAPIRSERWAAWAHAGRAGHPGRGPGARPVAETADTRRPVMGVTRIISARVRLGHRLR
jgi:hypothetical protein